MSDLDDLALELAGRLDDIGESPDDPALRRRVGTVTVVTGASYTVTIGGTSVPGVRSLVPLTVGDVVQVVFDGRRPLALNHVDTGWHVLGAVGEPALQNSWVNFDATNAPARFRKSSGITCIQGLIKNGTATGDTLIFTLPVTFRPGYTVHRAVMSGGVFAYIKAMADGSVKIGAAGASSSSLVLDLDFPADL